VKATTAVGLALALASTTLTNLAYLREHDAAAALPALSIRRPWHALMLLLGSPRWLSGFALESGGFVLYAAALALAPLSLVQSVAAGGIGVLAFVGAHRAHRQLGRRELSGVVIAVLGLLALGGSLAEGHSNGHSGSTGAIVLWLGAVAVAAVLVLWLGRRALGKAAAYGIAGGLFFSIGDVSTKVATQGGARAGFAVTLVAGYLLGTTLLQAGYQAGGALTVAGLATLLTNAVPIAAGPIVLGESLPPGALGALRVVAFVAVTVGAFLLAQPDPKERERARAKAELSSATPGMEPG
jgi:hypothetical protein